MLDSSLLPTKLPKDVDGTKQGKGAAAPKFLSHAT